MRSEQACYLQEVLSGPPIGWTSCLGEIVWDQPGPGGVLAVGGKERMVLENSSVYTFVFI